MVASRILFLSTYDTNLDFEALIKNNALGDNVNYVCCSTRMLVDTSTDQRSNSPATRNNSPNQGDGLYPRWTSWLSSTHSN